MAYSNPTNRDYISKIAEQIGETHIDDTTRRLQVKVKKATKVHINEDWGTYPIISSPRGVAVIMKIFQTEILNDMVAKLTLKILKISANNWISKLRPTRILIEKKL